MLKNFKCQFSLRENAVYELPTIEEIKNYCKDQVDRIWEEVKRFSNPHKYYVDLSQKLWFVKQELIQKHRNSEDNQ